MGSAVVRVFVSSAAMRGGAQSWAARTRSCSSVRLPGVGVFALVGSGCAGRSRRLARVRASGLVAYLGNEAVAGVAIVCPSTQEPCGYSTSVKRYGGATRRRWRRFPGQRQPRRRSAAMRVIATKSLVIWPHACWPEGCFSGHWRSGTTFSLATGGAKRRAVRKHRAPKGALRRGRLAVSALRDLRVRKHRAPNSALRRSSAAFRRTFWTRVRKHRAPKGALRLTGWGTRPRSGRTPCQKAPSAIRRIKT